MEPRKMNSMKYKPLSFYLKKEAHPSWHQKVNKRLHMITSPLMKEVMPDHEITMDECMKFLGIATFRRELVLETNQLIMSAFGHYQFIQEWAKELKDMFDNTNEMIKGLNQMANAILFESLKGKTNHV